MVPLRVDLGSGRRTPQRAGAAACRSPDGAACHGASWSSTSTATANGGHKTAHVGRQYLANLGKIDNGVVSVTSLWADEGLYYPLAILSPTRRRHHFARGKADPQFRTKRQIAAELVGRALEAPASPAGRWWPTASTAKTRPCGRSCGSAGWAMCWRCSRRHCWWHVEGTIGSLQEAVEAAPWAGPRQPGAWVPVERRFRDGHSETWWVLEVEAGPYGPEKPQRALVATTDPRTRPDEHLVPGDEPAGAG